jgi:hypothetical protein
VPTLNPSFSGSGSNTGIFNGTTGVLEAGQKVTVRVVVNIEPTCGKSFYNIAIGGISGTLNVYPSITPAGATGLAACTTISTATVGPDQTVCQDAGTVTLVPPANVGAGSWTVVKGAGTVAGNVYTLNTGDYDDMNLVEVVELKWVPTTPPTCTVVDLVTLVTVNHLPVVDAGKDALVCGVTPLTLSTLGATIKNNVSGITNGTWTATNPFTNTPADGVFVGTSRFLSATQYVPGVNDKATGRVVLTLTSDILRGHVAKFQIKF